MPATRSREQSERNRRARIFCAFRRTFKIKNASDVVTCLRAMGFRAWRVRDLSEEQAEQVLEMLDEIGPPENISVSENEKCDLASNT